MRTALMLFLVFLAHQSFSQVQKFTLDNGLRIVVKEDHRAPIAVSMIWYNVGSADESGGHTGLSHALEHIMFKGTAKSPLGVFSKTIAALGGEENAFTYNDYTVYFEKIVASKLPVCLELEADRMQNLLFSEEEFKKEISVIREERRLRTDDNPQALTFERYLAAAHLTEPYHHPIIGWMSDLYHMHVNDLKTWYQRFYAPNNATLVVVGDVHAEEVHQLALRYFGSISKHSNYLRNIQHEPPSLGKKLVQIHAPAQLPMLVFGYTVPSLKTAKEHWEPYALEIIAGILNAGDSARFTKNLIRGSHVASNVEISYNPYSRYQTQFAFWGVPAASHTLDELQLNMQKEVKRLQHERVNPDELKRIKTQLIAQKVFEKDSIYAQAMEIGMLETLDLGLLSAEQYIENVNAVTAEQLQQVVIRYFKENSMTEARLIPTNKPGKSSENKS